MTISRWRARLPGKGPSVSARKTHAGAASVARRRPTRGGALLMVLWISAALAAVAFSLANTVRGETDRAFTVLDEVRGYYLASGAVDRAALELLWGMNYQGERKIKQDASWVDYAFPSGVAHVELIPETAKFDVNSVPPDRLLRLVTALGVPAGQASEITQGILARRGGGGVVPSGTPGPSFSGFGASLQEVEELLSVRSITPEVLYGTYVPAEGNPETGASRLIRRSGLVDCLSVFGSKGQVDANGVDPAVLAALGAGPDGIQALIEQRRAAPLTPERLGQLAPMLGPAAQALRVESNSTTLTIRATAQVRLPNGQLSEVKRTVAALVKYLPSDTYDPPLHVLRWYDTTWSH